MSVSQPIVFIWGPPGTGKTETLAEIAEHHMSLGHRVLVLSYSNVAVDEAILRVYNRSKGDIPGKIMRYGYARDPKIREHDYLTPYNYVRTTCPELVAQRVELMEKRRHILRTSDRFEKIGKQLMQIREQLEKEEKQAVNHASFVATTVSKAVVDNLIFEGNFDAVIFDEASMAYIPQVVFAAGLANKHFVCLGDFSQLPPIVQSGNNDLNCDIFRYCGIVEAVDNGWGHEWLCMLNTQYRMHPEIAAFSSKTMYHNLLKSDKSMEERRKGIVDAEPFSGQTFHLVDISNMMAVRSKTPDNSRYNILSALISMGLAICAAKKHEVGLITPYNAQARLLRALASDIMDSRAKLKTIKCSTVHQFQGSEKDIIIFDAVDSNIRGYLGKVGKPLNSTSNDQANRLFNVAVTRARGKMIPVVNVEFMEAKKLPDDLIFRRMIDDLKQQGHRSEGDDVIKAFGGKIVKTYTAKTGPKAFLNDIGASEKEIVLDMPGGTTETKYFMDRLAEALINAKNQGVKVLIRTDKILSLPRSLWPYAEENSDISNPVVFIDRSIVWYGLPAAGLSFYARGTKILDAYKPIIRVESRRLCRTLYGFLKIFGDRDNI